MRATTIHGTCDIRLSEVADPTLEAPTDAIVKVTAACICGSDLWPYRGENDITPGDTIGHECIGVVEEVGPEVRDFAPGRLRDRAVLPLRQHLPALPGRVPVRVHDSSMTSSGQAEYARVGQADGSLVQDRRRSRPGAVPSLLTLTDVMATGWHAAVAAGVRQGGTAVVVGDGAVGLCGVLAASVMGAETIIAMSRHEPRQKIATEFGATHSWPSAARRAARPSRRSPGEWGRTPSWSAWARATAMDLAFAVARPGATVGFVGVPHGVELPVRRMFVEEHRARRRDRAGAPLPAGAAGPGDRAAGSTRARSSTWRCRWTRWPRATARWTSAGRSR